MQLNQYFSETDNSFEFTRQQASDFAKKVAGDFNPIHDVISKRFCIPGDLLFAVLLSKTGISNKMHFNFAGMVSDSTSLHINHAEQGEYSLSDQNNKEYLHVSRSGDKNIDPEFIENVVKQYVQFSGMNFPHIMVPLMEEKQLMINCQRPLVIYESMDIEFTRLDIVKPSVEFTGATMDIEGKRGLVKLNFKFTENGEEVGHGTKRMIATGLKTYDQEAIDDLVERFTALKTAYNN